MSDDDLLKGMGKVLRERREREAPLELRASKDAELAPLGEDVRRRVVEDALRAVRPAVIPLRRRRVLWGGGMTALAAVAAAWLLWPKVGAGALPGYELQLEGGDVERRSASAGERRVLSGGSHLELVVRPATPVRGPLEAHLFAVTAQGNLREAPPPALSESGVARWAGTPGALFPGLTGDMPLVIVVGRGGSVPGRDVALDAAGGWQILRTQIRVAP